MGQRHRRYRAQVKDLARRLNYRENEFGELVHKMTKAEARRIFVAREMAVRAMEQELIDSCIKKAKDEINAIEDAAFVQDINLVLAAEAAPAGG
jgi:hypothetical protein